MLVNVFSKLRWKSLVVCFSNQDIAYFMSRFLENKPKYFSMKTIKTSEASPFCIVKTLSVYFFRNRNINVILEK